MQRSEVRASRSKSVTIEDGERQEPKIAIVPSAEKDFVKSGKDLNSRWVTFREYSLIVIFGTASSGKIHSRKSGDLCIPVVSLKLREFFSAT